MQERPSAGRVRSVHRRPEQDAAPDGMYGARPRRSRIQRLEDFVREREEIQPSTPEYGPVEPELPSPPDLAGASEQELYDLLCEAVFTIPGAELDGADGAIHVVGVRGLADGQPTEDVPNRYDDTIFVLWRDGDGGHVRSFRASVDPGASYTESPLDDDGCAHLMNGQYEYKIGQHRGEYDALVQNGEVAVWRDRDADFGFDDGEVVEHGYFGINIHAGGTGTQVDRYSAGCQVIHGGSGGAPYTEFMDLARSHPFPTILYTLVDRSVFGFEPTPGQPY